MISLATLLSLSAWIAPPANDEALARELPRIPPKSAEEAIAGFRTLPGFHIEPIAVEPLVADPVALVQDERGRAYVVEMRGYPFAEKEPTGEVRLLEDRDDDGKYETSTVFLDRLNWPTSVVAYQGGVFVAAAPEIIYAKDTNGDGKADIRKVFFSGFGVQNVQALLNGLLWGPDGWIYGVSGGNGGSIKNHNKAEKANVDLRGRDFRFKPDGSEFEAIPGGGQFGHAFDDYGHRFTCNNSNHIRQIVFPEGVLERNPAYLDGTAIADIAAEGPAAAVFRISPPEPWRVVRTRKRRRSGNGRSTACDRAQGGRVLHVRDRSDDLSRRRLSARVSRQCVYWRCRRKPGPSQNARSIRAGLPSPKSRYGPRVPRLHRQLVSTREFLQRRRRRCWVLDMYRETIEHPLSIPEHIKKRLDLLSGRDRGRIYRIAPDGFKPRPMEDLSKLKTETLVSMLADRDGWWRETAARLLLERNDAAAIEPLRTMVRKSPAPLARLGAVQTLANMGRPRFEDIAILLHDADPGVREAGVDLLRRWDVRKERQNTLANVATDPDPMVRLRAAIALGDYPLIYATSKLKELLSRDHADRWIRSAVFTGLKGRSGELLLLLSNAPVKLPEEGDEWIEPVAELAGYEAKPESISDLVETFVPDDLLKTRYEAELILRGLAKGSRRAGKNLRDVLNDETKREIEPLIEAARKGLASELDTRNAKRALGLVALAPDEAVVETVAGLLSAKSPVELQLAAIAMLSSLRSSGTAAVVIDRWNAFSPAVRREAIEFVFARKERMKAFLEAAIAGKIKLSELDSGRVAQLRALNDAELKPLAERLLQGLAKGDRAKVIRAYAPALKRVGDSTRGKEIYRKHCATCHQAGSEGKAVGPPLTTVAAKSPEDLLTGILDPNRETAPIYANYSVVTQDGRVVTGMIASESGRSDHAETRRGGHRIDRA